MNPNCPDCGGFLAFDGSGETGYAELPSEFFALWECSRCGYYSIAGNENELLDDWGEVRVPIPRQFFTVKPDKEMRKP